MKARLEEEKTNDQATEGSDPITPDSAYSGLIGDKSGYAE